MSSRWYQEPLRAQLKFSHSFLSLIHNPSFGSCESVCSQAYIWSGASGNAFQGFKGNAILAIHTTNPFPRIFDDCILGPYGNGGARSPHPCVTGHCFVFGDPENNQGTGVYPLIGEGDKKLRASIPRGAGGWCLFRATRNARHHCRNKTQQDLSAYLR